MFASFLFLFLPPTHWVPPFMPTWLEEIKTHKVQPLEEELQLMSAERNKIISLALRDEPHLYTIQSQTVTSKYLCIWIALKGHIVILSLA